nr:unnamed protein product [Spirometra erinaceieuropaei]
MGGCVALSRVQAQEDSMDGIASLEKQIESEFRGRVQQPGERVLDCQQALRLPGRGAFPTMDVTDLSRRVLEHFIAGVGDPGFRKVLMREQQATRDKTLDLARQEEALQAACE